MSDTGDPAIALLRAAGHPRLDDAGVARLRERAGAITEWGPLLRLASRHGLEPLLQQNLEAHAADRVPPPVLQAMAQRFRQQATRNLQATAILFRVLDALGAAGIEAMPYKGPALAVQLYGNLALRQFLDLDVLVRPRDVARASELLTADRWRPHYPLSGARLRAHVRLSYVQLFEREGDAALELHWGVAPRFFCFPLDIEALWPRLGRVRLAGREVLAPSLEDLAVMLSVHGAKDAWERLEWIAGVAELARRPELDWAGALDAASELGGRRMVLLAVELARRLFDVEAPAAIAGRLAREPGLDGLVRAIEGPLLDGRAEPRPLGMRARAALHLAARERLRDRARYLSRLALTTTADDWTAVPLPERLAFLHPTVRAVRLAHKYLLRPPGPPHREGGD